MMFSHSEEEVIAEGGFRDASNYSEPELQQAGLSY